VQISQVLRRKGRDVATIDGAATVRTALELLASHRVGALVVSSDGTHIEGILSERDVARTLPERGGELLDDPVSSVMTADVQTVGPDSTVHELAQMMTDRRIRHVPVVEDGALAGIVSIGDVVKARLDELETERAQLVDYIQST
jgi:CBS domain-containing protein